MPLREYTCERCGVRTLAFDNETRHWDDVCRHPEEHLHLWIEMPPRMSVVIATNLFMTEDPQLDSLPTVYELDRQLTMEERDKKEMEIFQQFRRNA